MKDNEITDLNILVRFSKILLRFLKICCEGERGASDQKHEKQLSPIHSKIFWAFQKSNLEVWKSYSEVTKLEKSSNLSHFVQIERCLQHKYAPFAPWNWWKSHRFHFLSFVSVNILFLWHFKMHTASNYTIHLKLVKMVGQG